MNMFLIFMGLYLKEELLCNSTLNFLMDAKLFSTEIAAVYILPRSVLGFKSLHIVLKACYFIF
jgi:hypothetical protein